MITPAKAMFSDLSNWLSKQPYWLKHAAADLLAGKAMGDEEIAALAKLTVREVGGDLSEPESPHSLDSLGDPTVFDTQPKLLWSKLLLLDRTADSA